MEPIYMLSRSGVSDLLCMLVIARNSWYHVFQKYIPENFGEGVWIISRAFWVFLIKIEIMHINCGLYHITKRHFSAELRLCPTMRTRSSVPQRCSSYCPCLSQRHRFLGYLVSTCLHKLNNNGRHTEYFKGA